MQQVEIDARVGGEALIVERRAQGEARHRLRFEVIERPRRLVLLFAAGPSDDGAWTRVSIYIVETPTGCTLTLTHEMDAAWAEHAQGAGLVARHKVGRTHLCRLRPEPLAQAELWLRQWEKFWTVRLDAL